MSAKPKLNAKTEKAKAEPKATAEQSEGPKPKPAAEPVEEKKGRGKKKAEQKTEEQKKKEAEEKELKKKETEEKLRIAINNLYKRGVISNKFEGICGRDEQATYAKMFTKMVRSVLIHFQRGYYHKPSDYTPFPPEQYHLSVNNTTSSKAKADPDQKAPAPINKISKLMPIRIDDDNDTVTSTATPASSTFTDVQKDVEQKDNTEHGKGAKNLPSTTSGSCKAILGYIVQMYLQNMFLDLTFKDIPSRNDDAGPVKTITKEGHSFVRAVYYNIIPKRNPRVMLMQTVVTAVEQHRNLLEGINFDTKDFDTIKDYVFSIESPSHSNIYRERAIEYLLDYFKLLAVQVGNLLWTGAVGSVYGEHIETCMLNLDGMGVGYRALIAGEILVDNDHLRQIPLMTNFCADVTDYMNAYAPPTKTEGTKAEENGEKTVAKTNDKKPTTVTPATAAQNTKAESDNDADADDAGDGDDGDDADDANGGDDADEQEGSDAEADEEPAPAPAPKTKGSTKTETAKTETTKASVRTKK